MFWKEEVVYFAVEHTVSFLLNKVKVIIREPQRTLFRILYVTSQLIIYRGGKPLEKANLRIGFGLNLFANSFCFFESFVNSMYLQKKVVLAQCHLS